MMAVNFLMQLYHSPLANSSIMSRLKCVRFVAAAFATIPAAPPFVDDVGGGGGG
jgi:hypothetical protein